MSSTGRRGGKGGGGGGDVTAQDQVVSSRQRSTGSSSGRLGLDASSATTTTSTTTTTTTTTTKTSATTPPRENTNHGGGGGEWGSASRFGHFAKYTKPKIGPAFQCAVPLYVPPEQNATRDGVGSGTSSGSGWGESEAGEESGGSASGSAESSSTFGTRTTGRGGGRGGTGGRGNRGRGGGRGGRGRGGGRSGGGRGRGGGSSGAEVGGGFTAASKMMCEGMEHSMASGETSAVDIANAAAAHMQVTYGSRIIPRGGLCVHKPPPSRNFICMDNVANSTDTATEPLNDGNAMITSHSPPVTLDDLDDFLIFSRNIFLQTPRPHGDLSIDDIWDDATAKKFEVEVLPSGADKTGGGRGRGNKRKLADRVVDDDEAMLGNTLDDVGNGGKPLSVSEIDDQLSNPVKAMLAQDPGPSLPESTSKQLPLCGMEDDEQALAYLHANHHGDSQRAKFSIMVNYDRGYGVKRRKQLKKKRKEANASYPDATAFTSESWRWRVHQARPTMLGDYRSSSDCTYHYFDPASIATSDLCRGNQPWRLRGFTHDSNLSASDLPLPATRLRTFSFTWSAEEIEKAKKIWKSILAYSNSILGTGGDSRDNNSKPPLTDLLELVGKAHSLPTPEEAFGRRDPSARQMSENMNAVIDMIESGRNCVARILKCLKDDGEGIELDALQKVIGEIEHKSPVGLSELDVVKWQLLEATLWEEKLENNIDHGTADSNDSDGEDLITEKKLTLEKVERLVSKGQNLTLRPRSLVRLQNRIERAHILRRRISVWNEARNQENPQNLKFVSTLIKQANKIDLSFPELFTLTGVHKKAEEWMDRASIAVRTTISFGELESLVSIGESLPLNVSDVLEKLQNRLKQARDWMARVEEIVPKSDDFLVWLRRFRHALDDSDKNTHLVSLLAEESRIPVTMECSKLLQIEIDARNWSAKARPWIPENLNSPDGMSAPQRRGKIDDVEECLDRASSIRDRLWFGEKEKSEWVLDGESQLAQMVEMAESWFEKYEDIITYDSRRNGKLCIPMSKLRDIVEEVNRIPMNLGNPSTKMNKIFSQADEWMKKYYPLIKRCGIECTYTPVGAELVEERPIRPLKINELSTAVADADTDLTIDLDVIVKLRDILNQAQIWIDQVNDVVPKHDARKKGKQEKHTMKDLLDLIDQSKHLPVDVTDELEQLKLEQSTTISWRRQAQVILGEITTAFLDFRTERANGSQLVVDTQTSTVESETIHDADSTIDVTGTMTTRNINSRRPSNGVAVTNGSESPANAELEGKYIFSLVSNFLKSVKSINIRTPEGEVAEELNDAIVWLTKSSKLLSTPSEIYERKVISKLDKCVESGQKLVDFEHVMAVEIPEDAKLVDNLRESWASVVKDDIARLMDLQIKRDKFVEWCKMADGILASTEKKNSIDSLNELEVQCAAFPSTLDIVLRVKKRAKDATAWLTNVVDIVNSGRKIPMNEAKVITDEGEKLNISCPEYKTLRAALKATRGWLLRVKKCGAANGHAQVAVAVVTELINEHNSFLVTAMDELSMLKQAMCGYCICRQPYEGFMIGCDGCEEWYHGSCIGLSQEQAQKFDKYVCVRCSTLRIYSDYAASVAGILRKWTSAKGLAMARLADSQRYGRKVRSAERDLSKTKSDLENYERELRAIRAVASSIPPHINGDSQPSTVVSNGVLQHNGKGLKEKALLEKIEKARTFISSCEKRMEGYKVELVERQNLDAEEDALSLNLKAWCKMVKREVFAPMTREQAELSRPLSDGSNSAPMDKAIAYAQILGITQLPDVDAVLNAFKIFSWCLQLLEVLMRKPKVEEIRSLLSHSDSGQFKLPEAKCVRMLRSIASRALIWQAKAKRALMPIEGEVKPYDLAVLRELLVAAKEIPFAMPEETQVWNTIEDQGTRHCVCGGPGDGSFMLGCDKCDRWFHGSCMKIDTATGDALSNWICPPCSEGRPVQAAEVEKNIVQSAGDKIHESVNSHFQPQNHLDISPHAPNPISLWPPFGLRSSKEATEALGKVGVSDNEDFQVSAQPIVRPKTASSPTHEPNLVSAISASVPPQSISQIRPCQQVASAAITTAPSVAQSAFCQPVQSLVSMPVPFVASKPASLSTVESYQVAQSQKSVMPNNQMEKNSLLTEADNSETTYPPTSTTYSSSTVEAINISPITPIIPIIPIISSSTVHPIAGAGIDHTTTNSINNASLGADLSVAVANLDAFVLAAEDTPQLPPNSATANSLETGPAVEVSAQPPSDNKLSTVNLANGVASDLPQATLH